LIYHTSFQRHNFYQIGKKHENYLQAAIANSLLILSLRKTNQKRYMPEFGLEKREAYGKEYLKVFLRDKSKLANVKTFLTDLTSVAGINISNNNTDLTVYPAKLYSADETISELDASLKSYFDGQPKVSVDLTGWRVIERSIKEIQHRQIKAISEEQFQAIGLLCRETIISLAQAIYSEEKHPTLDDIKPSKTDAKRMLDAYISKELQGGTNEVLRKYARACNDLANDLTHRRTATAKDAALCSSATISLVNLMGVLENRL
jgi:hypothetical protein